MRRRTCLAGSAVALLRLAAPAASVALSGCGAAQGTRLGGLRMGMSWSVSLAGRLGGAEAQALHRLAVGELDRVEAAMSTWRPDSELSRLNAAPAGAWFAVSEGLLRVLEAARQEHVRCGGAFDATVGPLVDLWGFGARLRRRWPLDTDVAEALARAGMDALAVDPARGGVRKIRGDVSLDLCGIAKGHAVDRVAAALESAGVRDYLVDVGGELRSAGRAPRGGPWRVGIERPLPGRVEVRRVVALDGAALATSGDYRHYVEHAGRRYSHTVDPRSGEPVTHSLAAVSVIAATAMTADALSTAMMVLGPQAGPALAESLGVPALFQQRDVGGVVERMSAGFERHLVA
jgi:thiamine biosynthesis lipoprotein